MKTIILTRDDINNPLHPTMWEQLCEELGLDPKCDCEGWPEQIEIKVASAKRDD